MTLPYNLTLMGNSTGLLALVQLVNTELMKGWLGIMMLFMVAGISMIAFLASTNDAGKSFAATGFISLGVALLLRVASLVSDLALLIVVVVCAGAIAMARKT